MARRDRDKPKHAGDPGHRRMRRVRVKRGREDEAREQLDEIADNADPKHMRREDGQR